RILEISGRRILECRGTGFWRVRGVPWRCRILEGFRGKTLGVLGERPLVLGMRKLRAPGRRTLDRWPQAAEEYQRAPRQRSRCPSRRGAPRGQAARADPRRRKPGRASPMALRNNTQEAGSGRGSALNAKSKPRPPSPLTVRLKVTDADNAASVMEPM